LKKKLITILATLLLLIGNVIPALAAETVTIQFTTDKDSYTAQGQILVTGTVLKGTIAGKGTSPTLMFKNPSGKLVEVYQWQDSAISSDGSISKTITLGKNLVDGNYTITLSALTAQQVIKTVQITGYTNPTTPPPTASKELTINTVNNKVDYKTGETVDILGRVTEGGQSVGTIDVALSIEKSGTKLLDIATVTSAANGDYTSSFVIPSNFTAGVYSVKAILTDGKTATKDINITLATPPTPGPDPKPDPKPDPQPGPGPGPVIPVPVQDPKAPEFDAVSSESTVLTGKAEKGTKVTITDQKLLVLTAISGEDGKFSVTLPSKLKAGTKLYAIATLDSGQVSKETTIIVTDKTAPETPKVNEINDYNRLVKGQAEAYAKIVIKAGDKVIAEGKAGEDGLFALPITTQKAGTQLSITAIDTEGNVSAVTEITVQDKTPPTKAKVFKVSETKVIGKAEANATITISVGALEVASGQADENGNFSINMKAQKAKTKVDVTVTDEAGNISLATKVIVIDTTPPAIPTVTSVSQTKVTGKAEPNSYVFVKIGKAVIAIGKADSKGNYSITFKKQRVGTTLSVNAKDGSLNIGERIRVGVTK
jgi:hypothetical protein